MQLSINVLAFECFSHSRIACGKYSFCIERLVRKVTWVWIPLFRIPSEVSSQLLDKSLDELRLHQECPDEFQWLRFNWIFEHKRLGSSHVLMCICWCRNGTWVAVGLHGSSETVTGSEKPARSSWGTLVSIHCCSLTRASKDLLQDFWEMDGRFSTSSQCFP